MGPVRVLSVIGTRPELIKMAPVLKALSRDGRAISRVCLTGQHRTMLNDLLPLFEVQPDVDLEIMRAAQTPSDVLAATLTGLQPLLAAERPDWVVAQGDTTTVLAAAIAAFLARVPFAHVEAGLRSGDYARPFPEEFNRRVADLTAGWCFAPTTAAREHLLAEGIPAARVCITGNTAVDALLDIAAKPFDLPPELERLAAGSRRLVLVTAHRRESFGEPFRQLCLAVRDIAEAYGSRIQIVYPVHLNPNVRAPVQEILSGLPNVALVEPLGYVEFVQLMKRAALILTDSGGIQEEAPSLRVPVLVMRDVTERPEGIAAGTSRLVGTRTEGIVAAARELLDDESARARMTSGGNPYGDGWAAKRIVAALLGDAVEPFQSAEPAR